jgi:LemA protein
MNDNSLPFIIAGGVLLLLFFWVIAIYNRLVRTRNACVESWANVDTELKRRYDLIPNLVNVVKGYAAHEQATLQAVIQARNQALASTGSPSSQARDENHLVGALKNLLAVAERYPDLKASDQFLSLQNELTNTEDRIQSARRFYNANVRDLANLIETVPSNIIAGLFHFQKREYFEIEEAMRAPVKVDFAGTRPA